MKVMRLFLVLCLVGLAGACAGMQTTERSDRQDVLYACNCGPQCECNSMSTEPGNCACGMPVKRVSLAGTGIYFCNCGGSCFCNTVSEEPDKCNCGMNLKKAS